MDNNEEALPGEGGRTHSIDQELARLMSPLYRGAHIDPSWRLDAECAAKVQESPDFIDLWFSEEDTVQAATATSVCFTCPVREKCLEWASATKQREGIWGGQPVSIRLKYKGKPHNYEALVNLPDPYETKNKKSRFHITNLGQGDSDE